MRRGDVADGMVVVGWLAAATAVGVAWGWVAVLGFVGATLLVMGAAMATAK